MKNTFKQTEAAHAEINYMSFKNTASKFAVF